MGFELFLLPQLETYFPWEIHPKSYFRSVNISLIFIVYFSFSFTVCNQFSRGVFAMLGAVSPDSFDTLHSYSNTFQMPFVTPWFPEKVSLRFNYLYAGFFPSKQQQLFAAENNWSMKRNFLSDISHVAMLKH